MSVFLGAGASLALGILQKEVNWIFFISILTVISFLSLLLVWRRKLSRENFVLTDKHSKMSIALAVAYFAALIILYTYKTPITSPDGARYFFAEQNYIKSFSFSPYPPFPLESFEVGSENLGGAITYRNLWVIMMALQSLAANSASITAVRILALFLSSMLTLATFRIGSIVSGRKLGILASLFTALNPAIILFAPYEMPYIAVALFSMIGYSIYLSAVGGEKKDLRSAYVALFILLMTVLLHVNVFFFAVVLIPHLLYVSVKYGGKFVRIASPLLMAAFSLIGYYYFSIFMTRIFGGLTNLDFMQSLQIIYYTFLLPIYFTMPIWILFITGIFVMFAYKNRKTVWLLNLYVTILAISAFILTFAIFRFGVSFRFFLILIPLMTIIAVNGLLKEVKAHKSEVFFLNILFLILITYLANQYQYVIVHPFGVVTLGMVYLTFVPAIVVLIWKILWKESYSKFGFTVRKVKLNIGSILRALFVVVVALAMINETFIYVVNLQIGVFVNPIGYGLEEGGNWVNNNIESGSVIATNAWNHLGIYVNYTKTPIVPFPSAESSLTGWIYGAKIDYLVIFTNLTVSNDITWFHLYTYLRKYADSKQSPPRGTVEFYRGTNFVVYKVLKSFGVSPVGVMDHISQNPEDIWTLENGYVQLNITREAILFSNGQAAEYAAVTKLDFENTVVTVNGTLYGKLGRWDSIQWFDHAKNDWEKWNETSQPPQSLLYLQQQKVQLSWNKGSFSLFSYVTLERGRLYGQFQWRAASAGNDTIAIYASINPVVELNRAYIPSNVTTDWSTLSTLQGNPVNETMFGLGYMLSHTDNVTISDVIPPETVDIEGMPGLAYTFNITNDAYTDQWALVEAYVPDTLNDMDGDGFYSAGLLSYNVNDGRWWDFARWDLLDVGGDAAKYGPWTDSSRGTLLDGTVLSEALGYTTSYMQGVGLYDLGEKDGTALNIISSLGSDAPTNITYSSSFGLKSRLGFAVHLPGKRGMGSNQLSLRFYFAYNADTFITYQFSNSSDVHNGFGSINNPFIWFYNVDKSNPSMGLGFNKKPSSISFTVDKNFLYTNFRLGYSVPKSTQADEQLYTTLASVDELNLFDTNDNQVPDTFQDLKGDTILSMFISSLANYNYTFSQSDELMTLGFEKSGVDNEFNLKPLYSLVADGRWTWLSGERFIRTINDNDFLLDVSDTSQISFKFQPKAIRPSIAIKEQEYNASGGNLRITVASGYLSREMYGTLIIYMLRRVVVYTGNLTPTQVYVNSKTHEWEYDEANKLLRITIVDLAESEINVIFAHS